MCNPLSCLPCCQQPGQFAKDNLGLTDLEAQGIDDLFKKLCETLGCRDRADAGQITLIGVLHKNVLEALRTTYPAGDTNQCIAPAVKGIMEGLGNAIGQCPNGQAAFLQALLANIAPHIGKLLACIFGIQRGAEIQLQLYHTAAMKIMDVVTQVEQQARNNSQAIDLACLLPLLLQLLCGGTRPTPPPPPPPGGSNCCPPTGPPPGGGGLILNPVDRCDQ